jgi:hypothetical protein
VFGAFVGGSGRRGIGFLTRKCDFKVFGYCGHKLNALQG